MQQAASGDFAPNLYQNAYGQQYRGNGRGGSGWPSNVAPPQGFSPQSYSNGPKSPMSPNGKTLLANIEKYAETDNMRYIFLLVGLLHI